MYEALRTHFPTDDILRFTEVRGGYFMWIEVVHPSIDVPRLAKLLKSEKKGWHHSPLALATTTTHSLHTYIHSTHSSWEAVLGDWQLR